MDKVLVFISAVITVFLILLGVDWIIWKGWVFVLPQIYPTGPEQLINPDFWLFVIAFTLFSFIGKSIFGRSKE